MGKVGKFRINDVRRSVIAIKRVFAWVRDYLTLMKILVPYDGSVNADIALESLRSAEFALCGHEVLVVVTDVWLHDSPEEFRSIRAGRTLQMERSGISSCAPALRVYEEERFLSGEVRRRLETNNPSSHIRVETLPGNSLVSTEFLERAVSWGAELVILGSQVASITPGARRVASEVRCSVRIARNSKYRSGELGSNPLSPPRIAVILEGQDAGITEVVASRYWAAGSRALLITLGGPETLGGTFTQAAKSLTSAGLTVDTETVKHYSSLISQIHDWGADVVFLRAISNFNSWEQRPQLNNSHDALTSLWDDLPGSLELIRTTATNESGVSLGGIRPADPMSASASWFSGADSGRRENAL